MIIFSFKDIFLKKIFSTSRWVKLFRDCFFKLFFLLKLNKYICFQPLEIKLKVSHSGEFAIDNHEILIKILILQNEPSTGYPSLLGFS